MTYDAGTGMSHLSPRDPVWRSTWSSAAASGAPVSVGMVNPCRIRWFNDNLGHERGDELIRAVGEAVVRVVEPDLVSYGNGEFHFLTRVPPGRLRVALDSLSAVYQVQGRRFRIRVVHGTEVLGSADEEAILEAWQQAGLRAWVESRSFRYSEQRAELERAWESAVLGDST